MGASVSILPGDIVGEYVGARKRNTFFRLDLMTVDAALRLARLRLS